MEEAIATAGVSTHTSGMTGTGDIDNEADEEANMTKEDITDKDYEPDYSEEEEEEE